MKLEGVRVLDLSQFLPGPHFTMMMGDHGADVIRIESREGEPTRNIGARQGNASVWFRNTHRGKKSVVLDLKSDAGRARLMPLIKRADVVVEQFRPGVMARLGLGPRALRKINPRLIYCSITGYGQSGPRALEAGHDINYIGQTGLLALQPGPADRPNVPPALSVVPEACSVSSRRCRRESAISAASEPPLTSTGPTRDGRRSTSIEVFMAAGSKPRPRTCAVRPISPSSRTASGAMPPRSSRSVRISAS